jgi:outer membrane receptor for ferrienterochelin and colicins
MKKSLYLSALLCSAMYAETLEPILVSTTSFGKEKSIEDVQASVEVIDQKTIQSLSGRSVPQILNEAVGITVKDSGSTSSINMRGFSDAHTLILVDGLRRTGKYGNSDLNGIELEDIEKIEIVRGPMSALYGADALAGVVNIITKKAVNKTSAKATLIGGMAQNHERETGILRASANVGGETVSHVFSVELKERNDYRLNKDSIYTDLRNESKQFLSYGNTIKLGDDSFQTRLEFLNQDDDGVTSTSVTTYEKEKRYQLSGIYNHTTNDYLIDTNFGYGYSDAKVNRGNGLETTEYGMGEINTNLRHLTSDSVTNIFGIGLKREDIDVSMYSKTGERTNLNALYQNEWRITDNLSTTVGIRYDHYSDFGSTTNPRVSAKYQWDNFDFRVSYGEAFMAPSFTNMYSHFLRVSGPRISDISGNENLQPEESKTYEAAIGYKHDQFRLDIVYHHSKLDNLIQSYITGTAGLRTYYSYRNVAKATIEGVETSLTYYPTDFLSIKGSLAYLDTLDETTRQPLTESAKQTGKLQLAYTVGDISYFLNLKTLQNFYGADAARANVYSDYTTADIKTIYHFDNKTEFFAGIDNIQNRLAPYNISTRGTPSDPGERYYYLGATFKF